MEINDLFNIDGHVLVFGHADLDGAASATLVHAALDLGGVATRCGERGRRWARKRTRGRNRRRAVCRPINYGPLENSAMEYVRKWHSRYAAILFVDFSPCAASCAVLDSIGLPYFVIDHHQTAFVQSGNPLARYFMDYSVSGAMGVYNVFKEHLSMAHRLLAYLADDYDMWRHKNYMSKHMNVIYWNRYGFTSFIRHYANGFNGIGVRLIDKVIRPYYDGVVKCLDSLDIEQLPGEGAYLEMSPTCPYFSDITMILEKRFKWFAIARRKKDNVSISFRTRMDTVNLGMTLQGFGLGGGGHAKAAGQNLPADSDVRGFVRRVYDSIVETRPDAFD